LIIQSPSQPYTYKHIFRLRQATKYVCWIITTYEARNTHAFSVSWSTGPIHPPTKTQEVFLGFLGVLFRLEIQKYFSASRPLARFIYQNTKKCFSIPRDLSTYQNTKCFSASQYSSLGNTDVFLST